MTAPVDFFLGEGAPIWNLTPLTSSVGGGTVGIGAEDCAEV